MDIDDAAYLCSEVGEDVTLENVGEAGSYGLEDRRVAKRWIVKAGGVEEEGTGVGNGVELGDSGTFVVVEFNQGDWGHFIMGGK